PLYLSVMTDAAYGSTLNLTYKLILTNAIGERKTIFSGTKPVSFKAYVQSQLQPLKINIPDQGGLAILTLHLQDEKGTSLNRNFMHFEIISDKVPEKTQIISVDAKAFSNASFSKKQWDVLDGLKINGAGD